MIIELYKVCKFLFLPSKYSVTVGSTVATVFWFDCVTDGGSEPVLWNLVRRLTGEISANIFDMSVSQHFDTNTVKFRMFDVAFDTQNRFKLKL
jgi:hypothetical protein